LLATRSVFARDDSEPRGNPSPLFESCSVADRGDDCGCRHRSDARDRYQPSAGVVLGSCLVVLRADHGSVYEPEFSSNECNSEANSVINSYNALSSSQQQDLLNFLRSL